MPQKPSSKQTQPLQNQPHQNVNEFNKFLSNNVDFLNQRHQQHFKGKPFNIIQLQTKTRIEQAIKYIYDVFSFEKYNNDEKMTQTLQRSLRENIIAFVKKQPKKDIVFSSEKGVDLLKFCIQNNQMFAVHYDKKEKVQKSLNVEKTSQIKGQEKAKEDQKQQLSQEHDKQREKVKSSQKQEEESPMKLLKQKSQVLQQQQQDRIQNQQEPNEQIQNNIIQSLPIKPQQKKVQNTPVDQSVLKKQAKVIFEFYCKQLNAGGSNCTFEKIQHQSSSMTLGKFIAFTNVTGILYTTRIQAQKPKNRLVLDKKTIIQVFKNVSKGRKQIQAQSFFQILKVLNSIDGEVYQKLNMGREQGVNKLVRKLKYLNTPFSMKDSEARTKILNLNEKVYNPSPTGHSGMLLNSIKDQIQNRKQKLRYLPLNPFPNPNRIYFNEHEHNEILQQNQSRLKTSRTYVENKNSRYNISNLTESNPFMTQKLPINKDRKSITTNLNRNAQGQNNNTKIRIDKIILTNAQGIDGQNKNKDRYSHQFNSFQLGLLENIIQTDDNDDQFLKQYKIPKLKSNLGFTDQKNTPNFSLQKPKESVSNSIFGSSNRVRKNIVPKLNQRVKQVQFIERNNQLKRQKSLNHKKQHHHC